MTITATATGWTTATWKRGSTVLYTEIKGVDDMTQYTDPSTTSSEGGQHTVTFSNGEVADVVSSVCTVTVTGATGLTVEAEVAADTAPKSRKAKAKAEMVI